MKILIATPDYRTNSGGIVVLHRLAKYLSKLGHIVETSGAINPDWAVFYSQLHIPGSGLSIEAVKSFDLVILPEVAGIMPPWVIVPVVRWVLNVPGKLGGPTAYPANEVIYHFVDELKGSAVKAAHDHTTDLFTLGGIDWELFLEEKPDVFRKPYDCCWGGKGIINPDALEGRGVRFITHNWPKTKRQLARILWETDTLWSFDGFSGIEAEALLCGCDVMIFKDGVWTPYEKTVEDVQNIVINEQADLTKTAAFLTSAVARLNKIGFSIKL